MGSLSNKDSPEGTVASRVALESHSPTTHVLLAAMAQIDLALREAQGPVAVLGKTLEGIALHLGQLRRDEDTHQPALKSLTAELATAIQSMQFYDRMFQHLSHVHDYLADAAEDLGEVPGDDNPTGRWEVLRERLFSRLLTDGQRDVLDALLPPGHWQERVMSQDTTQRTAPGDIELFE